MLKRTIALIGAITILAVACGPGSGVSTVSPAASPAASPAVSPAASPAVSPTAAPLTGVLAMIKQTGELRVAGPTYIPFIIRKPDGSYDGIEPALFASLATQLTKDLGVAVKLVVIPDTFATAVAGLQTGKYWIAPSLNQTPAREQAIDFTMPILSNRTTFYMKSSGKPVPTAVEGFNSPDYTIVVNLGSSGDELLTKMFPKANIKRIPNGNPQVRLAEVISGRSDVSVADYPVEAALIRAAHGTQITFVPSDPNLMLTPQSQGWGLPKGDSAWKAYVDGYLASAMKSGELKGLLDRWLSPDVLKQLQ